MGTHEYPWILQYLRVPHSGYPRGYVADTGMIFFQWSGHGYHTICIHGYPLTSLTTTLCAWITKQCLWTNCHITFRIQWKISLQASPLPHRLFLSKGMSSGITIILIVLSLMLTEVVLAIWFERVLAASFVTAQAFF